MIVMKPCRSLWLVLAAILVVAPLGCTSSESESGMGETNPPSTEYGVPATSESTVTTSSNWASSSSMPQEVPPASAPSGSMQEITERELAGRGRQSTLLRDYIDLGKRYLEEGRIQPALEAFGRAVEVDPTNQEALDLYQRTSAIAGDPRGATRAEARDVWNEVDARLRQAHLLVRDHMNRGHSFTSQGQHAAAISEYEKALIILQMNPNLDADFDEAQVKAALASAKSAKAQGDRESEAARRRDIDRINSEREERERQKIARTVERLWDQAQTAFERESFSDCESLCASVIDYQFNHEGAHRLKELARRARHEKANATNIELYREEWGKAFREVKLAANPPARDVTFPSDWDRIAARGPVTLGQGTVKPSEVDEEIRRRLEGTMLANVEWNDQPLADAVKFLRNSTSVNINVMSAVAASGKSESDLVLKGTFTDISAMSALRNAVDSLGLEMLIADGQVKITTKEEVRKSKVVEFYEVRDLTSKIQNFPGVEINLNPSNFGAGVSEEAEDTGEAQSTIDEDRLIELIRGTVEPVSWTEDAENTITPKQGTLVVRQTPEVHRKIRTLLADLRRSAGVQVQIESRFISVENNFLQEVGVDFRGLGDQSGGVGAPGLGNANTFDDFGAPGANGVLGTDATTGAFYGLGGGNGDIRGRTQNLLDTGLGNPETLSSTGGFSLQYAYLDDTQLEAILRATQKYERVNTVTAPNLLVYNTQRANLQVTNQVAYVKDFAVEVAQAAVIADPIIDIVKEGVVLDVRPIVSNDRRFVTLELRPSVSTLVRPVRTYSSTLGVGTAVTFEVPELRKQSLKTTVVMPDGGTLLLGGLKFYEDQTVESGIPILKDIPVLEFFFSRKGKYTGMKDLIVLLRVKILVMEELEPGGRR